MTLDEIAQHNRADDCYMAIKGKVYNVTPYLEFHPGGPIELLRGAGIDATEAYEEIHPWVNEQSFLKDCLVGFVANGVPKPPGPAGLPCPTEYRSFVIQDIKEIAPSTKRFRFSLPGGHFVFPVASHVLVKPTCDFEKDVPGEREYTVISEEGSLEIVVKLYPNGRHTSHLHSRRVGDQLQLKGPISRYHPDPTTKRLGLLAAGTGVAPMLQILRSLNADTTAVLICADRDRDEILLAAELATAAKRHPSQGIELHRILSQPPPEGWEGRSGHVDEALIRELFPPPGPEVEILVCGPIPFNKDAQDMLAAAGYAREQVFTF